jgi:glutaconate CoA-transferase subunit A
MMVDGVVERAGGAGFTSCVPDYERDETLQKAYADSARSPEAWAAFRAAWLDTDTDVFERKEGST